MGRGAEQGGAFTLYCLSQRAGNDFKSAAIINACISKMGFAFPKPNLQQRENWSIHSCLSLAWSLWWDLSSKLLEGWILRMAKGTWSGIDTLTNWKKYEHDKNCKYSEKLTQEKKNL